MRHEAHVVLREQDRPARHAEAIHERELRVLRAVEIQVEVARPGEVAERARVEVGEVELRAFEERAARARAGSSGTRAPRPRALACSEPSRSSSRFGRRSTAHTSSLPRNAATRSRASGSKVVAPPRKPGIRIRMARGRAAPKPGPCQLRAHGGHAVQIHRRAEQRLEARRGRHFLGRARARRVGLHETRRMHHSLDHPARRRPRASRCRRRCTSSGRRSRSMRRFITSPRRAVGAPSYTTGSRR